MEEVSLKNKHIYVLEYSYEIDDPNYDYISYYALIGIFESMESAEATIDFLMTKPGFKDHSRQCFNIDSYKINETEWKGGFVHG